MKIYNLVIALICTLFIVSCGNEYDTTEYFDLEELPGYVAFDADGNNAIKPDVKVAESAGSTLLTVENPTGTMSDITVSYTLSGSAVYGTDYEIDGASSAGGSVIISSERGDFNETYRADIDINILTDGVIDGEKVITVTLSSATRSEGDLAVGRGGTDFLKSVNIVIADIDM